MMTKYPVKLWDTALIVSFCPTGYDGATQVVKNFVRDTGSVVGREK